MSIILNKETTTFSLQDMFRHSYVIFSCKCDFNVYNFFMLLAMENQKAAEDSHNRENINSPLNNTSFIDQACLVEMAG